VELFLVGGRQHFLNACDDLPGMLDRSLTMLDLGQERCRSFFASSISADEELKGTAFLSLIAQP